MNPCSAICRLRRGKEWSRAQLALTARVPYDRVIDLEDGATTATSDERERIAAALDYTGSLERLFGSVTTSTTGGRHLATSTTRQRSKKISLGDGLFVLVDASDYERVKPYSWTTLSQKGVTYAAAWIPELKRTITLHRFVMGRPKGLLVHHKNSNGLDDRRGNLVVLTHSEHRWTQAPRAGCASGYKGVCRHPERHGRPWVARITVHGRRFSLGYYASEVEAARAYNSALRKFAGFGGGIFYNNTPGPRFAMIRATDETLARLNDYALIHSATEGVRA